jgi:hypothetical protein
MLQRRWARFRMLSKTGVIARTLLICVLVTGCVSLPWANEPQEGEVNLVIKLENNLLFLPTAQINGRSGRYFLGSAGAHSVLDPQFEGKARSRSYKLQLNDKTTVNLSPVILPLAGLGDAMIAGDAWTDHAITIDYRSGLLSYQREGIHPAYMSLFEFEGEPAILVEVDGHSLTAVVDTAVPDTLVLPGQDRRGSAHVSIAGTDFGTIDIAHAKIPRARIGNRLLSKFLVTIDYGRHQVGLWRDPRIPL